MKGILRCIRAIIGQTILRRVIAVLQGLVLFLLGPGLLLQPERNAEAFVSIWVSIAVLEFGVVVLALVDMVLTYYRLTLAAEQKRLARMKKRLQSLAKRD